MAIKVFLSSVRHELEAERKGIRDQVERLGEICVCMESYGSASTSAAEFDESAVAACDLYLCIVGLEYGSVDPASGKSYTEMEFDAALKYQLPCLAYFRAGIVA